MNMPKVSIILPVYNAQSTVQEAINSIIAQSFTDYEVIIIDDGSSDDTAKIVLSMQESTPKKIIYLNQANQGPAAARNRGMQEATGEYIAFLDADDLWSPLKLAKQIERMNQNPEVVLCFTDMSHVVNGEIVYDSYLHQQPYRYLGEGRIYENLLRQNFIFTPTVLFKREILSRVGIFDETLRIAEDYDLWLRITREFPVSFIDEVLVTRRRNGHNITEDKKAYIEHNITLKQKLLKKEAGIPERCAIIRRKLYYDQFNLAYMQFEEGLFVQARRSFWDVLKDRRFIMKSLFYIALTFLPINMVKGLRGFNQRNFK